MITHILYFPLSQTNDETKPSLDKNKDTEEYSKQPISIEACGNDDGPIFNQADGKVSDETKPAIEVHEDAEEYLEKSTILEAYGKNDVPTCNSEDDQTTDETKPSIEKHKRSEGYLKTSTSLEACGKDDGPICNPAGHQTADETKPSIQENKDAQEDLKKTAVLEACSKDYEPICNPAFQTSDETEPPLDKNKDVEEYSKHPIGLEACGKDDGLICNDADGQTDDETKPSNDINTEAEEYLKQSTVLEACGEDDELKCIPADGQTVNENKPRVEENRDGEKYLHTSTEFESGAEGTIKENEEQIRREKGDQSVDETKLFIEGNNGADESFIKSTEIQPTNKYQKFVAPLLLDIGLPTLDVVSDVILIVTWFLAGHWKYGSLMIIPLIPQFLWTCYKWFQTEKSSAKKWSWIFLLLQLWPQLQALKLLRQIYAGNEKKVTKQEKFINDFCLTEPFLESLPTAIFQAMLSTYAMYCNNSDCDDERTAVFGGMRDAGGSYTFSFYQFYISFGISVLSVAFGMTKMLLKGPCPMLPSDGPLQGLLTWRFFIAFLSVLSAVFTKVQALSDINLWVTQMLTKDLDYHLIKFGNFDLTGTLIFFICMFVPSFLLALVSILSSTGLNKKFLKLVSSYPGMLILPVVTFVSMGPRKGSCCMPNNGPSEGKGLGFSRFFTVLNILIHLLLAYPITILMFYLRYFNDISLMDANTILSNQTQSTLAPDCFCVYRFSSYLLQVAKQNTPSLFLSLVFNVILLCLDTRFCCNQSKCCRSKC